MGNVSVVNAIGIRETARRPLVDGASAFERAVAFGRGLPGVEETVLLMSEGSAGTVPRGEGLRVIERPSWSVSGLLEAMKACGDGRRDVFYFFGDCPFLDPVISARMHANHVAYFADYTFADGYPYGVAPEILTVETVGRLHVMAGPGGSAVPGRESIFDLLRTDINSFDIETELAPRDQRLMRVSLTADTERNFLLLGRAVSRGVRDGSSAAQLLEEHPELTRTLPAYFPIQVVERCPQACSYCPYPLLGGDVLSKTGAMDAEVFASLVGKISRFCSDAVVGISLWGEPSLHPRIFDIVRSVLATPGIDLVIETSGLGWDPAALRQIRQESERVPTWIVSLDAASESVYGSLRGKGYAEARDTADALFALFPGAVHVQAVRMGENEEDLQGFYASWKKRTENVIIQKYDTYAGFLPERKVADLSPVQRFPCWHIKRDFPVLIDGTVPLCREDLRREHVLGNLINQQPEEIWGAGDALYRRHLAADYPEICARCDEWYTYNF